MFFMFSRKILIISLSAAAFILCGCFALFTAVSPAMSGSAQSDGDFIKWVDFNVSYEALHDAMEIDISTYGTPNHQSWIDLLACICAVNGNNFSNYTTNDLTKFTDRIANGESMEDITKDLSYYSYYKETLSAVLSGYIGEYYIQKPYDDTLVWERCYGLKAFCPIAKNYSFEHYDDFANTRTYGFTRRHTGHDLFGSIGTPVVAIESGMVECVGWNQYGGWRIGIRSFDGKRYYYYAHLRKDHPYSPIVKEGETVKAGDVIGYLGMTGYSTTENVNNINVPHLHMGVQLIFDESQKDGDYEIWIDDYNLVKLLQSNCSEVYRDEETGEYVRRYDFSEPSLN